MADDASFTGTFSDLVKNTTINDKTLLSTDYLNHYNELVMILEMVPDFPDMMVETETWAPKTYQEHFQDSTFQHKDLAVWAYENAPDQFRKPLDDCIARCDATILDRLPKLAGLVESGDMRVVQAESRSLISALRNFIELMSALINGAMDAEQYFTEFEAHADSGHSATVMDQSRIDALFD